MSLALRTPSQLRALLVASVAISLIWGAIATWTVVERESAANAIVASSGPLSYDAQQVFRSLSDADATEANGYLSGTEPATAITRDIKQAEADLLAIKAGDSNPVVQADLTTLATGIPIYEDYVGEADAFNRENQLVGAAWLGDASTLMNGALLVAASDLYQKENTRLDSAYAQATGFPFLAIGGAVLIGIAAIWAQRWLARRTRRIINPGLAAASLIGLLSLAWLIASFASARSDLVAGRDQGSTPAQALAQAEITALHMHSDESITLISRDIPKDPTEVNFEALLPVLTKQLVTAQAVGAGSPGETDATAAARAAQAWYNEHGDVYKANKGGQYTTAVTLATGPSTTSFMKADAALTNGIAADQAAAERHASGGDDALGGVTAGMIIAALLMTAASTWGVGVRIAEYR